MTLLLLLCSAGAIAQQKFTVSGTVKDLKNGEQLIGATIQVQEMKGTGTVTNEYGFYSITLPAGTYTFDFSYSGYKTITEKITLSQNQRHDISLGTGDNELKEVVVSSVAKNNNVTNAQTGVEKLDIKDIKDIPVLFGERDVMKTLQLLPGVKSAGEGNSGFYVRGGSADQNLILLDEAPVYNASHLLGFFSTFNSDAIKNVTLYKGNMPAQYGGRLSSVLDVKMNDGDKENYNVSGGLGLISSKLQVEGPIKKKKSSFLITGRRTYADMFLKLSNDSSQRNNKLYFYDLNAKANWDFSDKDKLYLSGYFGKDVIGVGDVFGINWGNTTATLRWNHIFSSRLFSNTSAIYSKYNYVISINSNGTDFKITSRIQDWNLKQEFQYFLNPSNSLKFGFNTIYHTITPGEITSTGGNNINNMALDKRYSWDNAIYVNNEWKASQRLNVNYGIRATAFSILGAGKYFDFDNAGNVLDTMHYSSGQFVKTYFNVEPRASASFIINEESSVKASYARNTQNLHLLSNSTSASPTDRWIASTNNIKPEIADQVALGYYRNFDDNKYEFSVETYYKAMQNQIDYKNGADIYGNELVESQLLFGKGRAYGVEFYVKKKVGRFTGWIGYTLSRTEKLIDGINNDSWYPAKQDRTHDISVVGIYKLNSKWTVSATWVYYTGNAVTFPSGKYTIDNQTVFYYTERNGYRMPAYHRLDLGATKKLKEHKHFTSELAFSLYNAYGRENAYSIEFRQSESNPQRTEAVQTTLFRWVPSISYNFHFK
ncbi:TonB-dependent receptor [Chitinophagaceae bacterium MMS25-I14]